MKAFTLAALLCLSACPVFAEKTLVAFDCTCDDPVGSLFATSFRDMLASSPRYAETSNAEVTAPDGTKSYHFHVRAVSLDPTNGKTGQEAVLSVVILIGKNDFMNNLVLSCPRDRVTACAADALSDMDQDISSLK